MLFHLKMYLVMRIKLFTLYVCISIIIMQAAKKKSEKIIRINEKKAKENSKPEELKKKHPCVRVHTQPCLVSTKKLVRQTTQSKKKVGSQINNGMAEGETNLEEGE